MKKIVFISASLLALGTAKAQITINDSTNKGKVTIIKDSRIDVLEKKEAGFNEAMNLLPKAGRGYRLMVLSTNDRPLAMKVRGALLQRYPDQKIYMVFQPPNIKLKFGDYIEKADAENVRKDMLKNKIVTGNIYIVPDKIEIKPDKNNNGDK
ncbi:MAG: hypothetical protein V4685_05405 [Bacteroidota bacterium]